MDTNEIEFMKEWLSLDKYPFKIITVITILADSNGIFQGNLKDICKELRIQYNQGSKNRIFTALTDLTQEKYICTTVDKDIFTISLATAAKKARGEWGDYGRPKAQKPDNWNEVITQWHNGDITAVKAMELTGLKKTTFYKLAKQQG